MVTSAASGIIKMMVWENLCRIKVKTMPGNKELQFRKMMGNTYLNEDRVEEAVKVYAGLLRDYPDDCDSLLVMGNLYLAAGDGKTAETLFQRALKLAPDNVSIQRQVWLAQNSEGNQSPEPIPTDPDAIHRILQVLTGKKEEIPEEKINQAANLLSLIVRSPNPSQVVTSYLNEIDDLLPALIELNIRQARADGKYDLAGGLSSLRDNIMLQKQNMIINQVNAVPQPVGSLGTAAAAAQPGQAPQFRGNVLFLTPEGQFESDRLALLQEALKEAGCQVEAAQSFGPDSPRPDVVVIHNAHLSPRILESAAALSAAAVPLVVDLDQDFEHMPVTHPNYSLIGLNTPARARAFSTALLLADRVIVNSEFLASSVTDLGYQASLIPDGWSKSNTLWAKPSRARKTINIGWMHTTGQVEDLALVRRVLVRILREFPNTQMVVIGDSEAYRLFESISESRRIFLPAVEASEIQYLLSQVDILIAPARNTPYQMSFSDRPLMLAGARGIPWVASSIPSYAKWREGGILASDLDDWYLALRQLVVDSEMRLSTGLAGNRAARQRDMELIVEQWLQVFTEVVQSARAELTSLSPENDG
jgi:tetratricopeptide (TPR) repeat protein